MISDWWERVLVVALNTLLVVLLALVVLVAVSYAWALL